MILLVDDEPDLVVTYARLLRRHWFEVMTATGWESALAIIQSLTAQPAVVITELRLSADEGGDGHGQGPQCRATGGGDALARGVRAANAALERL